MKKVVALELGYWCFICEVALCVASSLNIISQQQIKLTNHFSRYLIFHEIVSFVGELYMFQLHK